MTQVLIKPKFGKLNDVRIRADSLIPSQQISIASKILRSSDCYQQRLLKFDGIGVFHSYAEYLHAGLLESDPTVSTFTPQPFNFQIGRRRYVPDCYYVQNGKRFVVEIKPRGEFREDLSVPLTSYLEFYEIDFSVVANEEIMSREVLALNWVNIVQTLVSATYEDTSASELRIWERFNQSKLKQMTIGDVIDQGNRIGNRGREIALYRLAHWGKLQMELRESLISFDTEVSVCE